MRWLFERSPCGSADFILREVAQRLLQRLDYIRLEPRRVLDAGCGSGSDLLVLAKRYPDAQALGLDFSLHRLRQAQADRGFSAKGVFKRLWRRAAHQTGLVAADLGQLPFCDASLGLIWSNLALHWHPAPQTVFLEWRRVLADNGLVMFSTFGPDTLKEVRFACEADQPPGQRSPVRVASFTDMHDYGDMLIAAGWSTPVMDVERLTLTFSRAEDVWRDVRALGGNPLGHRARGLLGKAAWQRINAALDQTRDSDGRYRLSFEIIHGHAWKPPAPQPDDGSAIVHFHPRRSSSATRQ